MSDTQKYIKVGEQLVPLIECRVTLSSTSPNTYATASYVLTRPLAVGEVPVQVSAVVDVTGTDGRLFKAVNIENADASGFDVYAQANAALATATYDTVILIYGKMG